MKLLFRTFRYRMIAEFAQIRTRLVLCLFTVFIFALVAPISDICRDLEMTTTPFVYPHLLSDYRVQLVVFGIVLSHFSACPYKDSGYQYIVGRCGIRKWNEANIIYIVVMSLLFNLLILASSVLALRSYVSWANDWGKIYGTLARTTLSYQYEINFTCSDFIIGTCSPVDALLLSFTLGCLGFTWVGLLVYCVNSYFNNSAGCIVAGGFLLLDIMIANSANPLYYLFSPVTLARLSTYTRYYAKYHLSMTYGFSFFIAGIIVFIILSKILYAGRELL